MWLYVKSNYNLIRNIIYTKSFSCKFYFQGIHDDPAAFFTEYYRLHLGL